MSAAHPRDSLLSIARLLVGAGMGVVAFVGIMVTIGLGAALTAQRGEILAKVAAAGVPDNGYAAIIFAMVLIIALLTLTFLFLRELFRIIGSVESGDPFVPINADRLGRMAWLNLASQLILFVLAGIGASLDDFRAAIVAEDALSIGTAATLLTLVLFILARVFRVGAEMREELDGTV